MSPIAHFIGSWLVATTISDNTRDRRLITRAGVLPDLDGAGAIVDVARAIGGHELTFHYYAKYHHLWLHGWPAALLFATILESFARQRWRVMLGCLLTFHLHLACDLLGSRGPSPSDLWPICYGEPLFRHPVWFWKNQWPLYGWQNRCIFIAIFALALWIGATRGHSFVEVFNKRLDEVVVGVLAKWRKNILRNEDS